MAKGVGWTSRDWYAAGESQIHFFPTPKRLIWTVGKKIMLEVEAWGGIKGVRHHHYPHEPCRWWHEAPPHDAWYLRHLRLGTLSNP